MREQPGLRPCVCFSLCVREFRSGVWYKQEASALGYTDHITLHYTRPYLPCWCGKKKRPISLHTAIRVCMCVRVRKNAQLELFHLFFFRTDHSSSVQCLCASMCRAPCASYGPSQRGQLCIVRCFCARKSDKSGT